MNVIAWILLGAAAQDEGVVEFYAKENDRRVPFRIHLRDDAGKPVKRRERVAWDDHWVADGGDFVGLPAGKYQVAAERGPEFDAHNGTVSVSGRAEQGHRINFT